MLGDSKPFGFGPRGVAAIEQRVQDKIRPRQAKGSIAKSLRQAAKRWQLFVPYIFPLVLSETDLDPLTEVLANTGKPSRHIYWDMPRPVFDYGVRGRELGLPEQRLHAVPKTEWPEISTFLKSMVVFHPGYQTSLALRLQTIKMLDPYASLAKQVDDIEQLLVEVTVFALESPVASVFVKPLNSADRIHASYYAAMSRSVFDPRLQTFVEAFILGDEPTAATERAHGQAKMDDDGVADGADGPGDPADT